MTIIHGIVSFYNEKPSELAEGVLKGDYCIPRDNSSQNVDKTIDSDFNFILNYRRQLYSVVNGLANAEADRQRGVESPWIALREEKVFNDLLYLAFQVRTFMQEASKENVMRRLVFIDRIQGELKNIQTLLREDYKDRVIDNLEEKIEKVESFLSIVATEALSEDGKVDKLADELTKDVAEKMLAEHRSKFLSYIEPDDLCIDDIYYLMGYSLRARNHADKHYDKFYAEHCEDCEKDDCMLSYCDVRSERNEIENESKLNQTIYDLAKAKIYGQTLQEDKIDYVSRKAGNANVIKNILSLPLYEEGCKEKKVTPFWRKDEAINIIPAKLYKELKESLSKGKGVDFSVVNDIAIRNLLTNFDFSNALGGKLLAEQEEFYKEIIRYRESLKDAKVEFGFTTECLLREFDKKTKIEILEQGKGDN